MSRSTDRGLTCGSLNLSCPDGAKRLRLVAGDVVFWIDGLEHRFRSVLHSELILFIANLHPETASLEAIFAHFREVYPVGSPTTLERTVHKIVHGARQDLVRAGLTLQVIRNVRGLGYRLAEGWIKEDENDGERLLHAELEELRALADSCVVYMESRPVIESAAGILYLDAERLVVQENFSQLCRIGWQMLRSFADPELVPDILAIKRELSALMSYVAFWRVGHRITEEAWRLDYRREIAKSVEDIEMRVRKIERLLTSPRPPG